MANNKLYGVLAIAVFIGLILYANGANIRLPFTTFTDKTFVVNPLFGTYSCERDKDVSNTVGPKYTPGGFLMKGTEELFYTCPANSPSCTFSIGISCGFIGCGDLTSTVNVDWVITNIQGGTETGAYGFPKPGGVFPRRTSTNLFSSGEQLHLTVKGDPTSTDGLAGIDISGSQQYTAYRLAQRDFNGFTQIVNSEGCSVVKMKVGSDQFTPEYCVENCDKILTIPNLKNGADRLDFNAYQNYLGGYSLAPEQSLVPDTDGQQVYCAANSVRILKEFKTDTGRVYVVPDTVKRAVECCPGDTIGNKKCSAQFKFVDMAPPGIPGMPGTDLCDAFGTVNSCAGAGSWVTDPTDAARQTQKRATGCDAAKNCVYATRQVGCTNSLQCTDPTKPICGVNNVCVATSVTPFLPTCGDNICAPGEKTTCPQDCKTVPFCGDNVCQIGEAGVCPQDCPAPFTIPPWIWIPILAALGGLVGWSQTKRPEIGIIFAIAGGLAGYALYWLITLPAWAQWLLTIGVVATGGVFIYVFAGAIVLLVTALLMAAARKVE